MPKNGDSGQTHFQKRAATYMEELPAIHIRELHLRGWRYTDHYGPAERVGRLIYHWHGRPIGELVFRATVRAESGTMILESTFGDGPTAISLVRPTSAPGHRGGRHWFFVCPVTGKRARKLYRWPMLGFCHRAAVPSVPLYKCQLLSRPARTALAMQRIRERLGGHPELVPEPAGLPKPAFYRLRLRYAELQLRLLRHGTPALRFLSS